MPVFNYGMSESVTENLGNTSEANLSVSLLVINDFLRLKEEYINCCQSLGMAIAGMYPSYAWN